MVDFKKKVAKHAPGLAPDEQILGALLLNPLGTTAGMTGGAVGGLVGAVAAGKIAKKKQESEAERIAAEGSTTDGLAASFPAGRGFLSLTSRRWVVHELKPSSGKPKDLVAEFAHGDITSIRFEKGKLSSKLALKFSDGSQVPLEVPKGSKVEEFIAAAGQFGVRPG